MSSAPTVPIDTRTGRQYGGVAAEHRVAARRARLLDAAVHLIGTQGYRALRLRSLCDEAGLTQRYLYESFESVEDVLSAVLDAITEENLDRLVAAAGDGSGPPRDLARRMLDAFVDAVVRDPRRCRIQFIEVVGVSPRIEAQRRQAMQRYASLIADGVREVWDIPSDVDVDRTAVAVVGAVEELLVAWVHGEVAPDTGAIVEALTALVLRAFGPIADACP